MRGRTRNIGHVCVLLARWVLWLGWPKATDWGALGGSVLRAVLVLVVAFSLHGCLVRVGGGTNSLMIRLLVIHGWGAMDVVLRIECWNARLLEALW